MPSPQAAFDIERNPALFIGCKNRRPAADHVRVRDRVGPAAAHCRALAVDVNGAVAASAGMAADASRADGETGRKASGHVS